MSLTEMILKRRNSMVVVGSEIENNTRFLNYLCAVHSQWIHVLPEEFQQAIPRGHQSFVFCHSYWRWIVQTQPLFKGGGVTVPFQVFPLSEAFILPLQPQAAST
ncbi:hypothetical protein DY000_02059819 [Brassica cretica]|uniref:Uncharacterized protein n=1 Tax=Brassica cretica TaxID=69181 RepID=A0ABQ7AQ27_BRACR|nr:hypothetical protein DY000_02059819 [Brassica cretica]